MQELTQQGSPIQAKEQADNFFALIVTEWNHAQPTTQHLKRTRRRMRLSSHQLGPMAGGRYLPTTLAEQDHVEAISTQNASCSTSLFDRSSFSRNLRVYTRLQEAPVGAVKLRGFRLGCARNPAWRGRSDVPRPRGILKRGWWRWCKCRNLRSHCVSSVIGLPLRCPADCSDNWCDAFTGEPLGIWPYAARTSGSPGGQ